MEPLSWQRDEGTLWCRVDIDTGWRQLAEDYVLHRLRRLRARRVGLLHPDDVAFDDGRLLIRFRAGAMLDASQPPRAQRSGSFGRWRNQVLLPALMTLVECHRQDVTGFAPFRPAAGRWVPPVSWFLPPRPGAVDETSRRADWRHAHTWFMEELQQQGRPDDRRDVRLVESIGKALERAEGREIERLIRADRDEAARSSRRDPDAPSFLALLTEAELLERVATVYRYRLLREEEAARHGIGTRGQHVIEVDPGWEDPHFPPLVRPSPQELWDSLIDESRTTPVLALSRSLPNPLDRRLGAAIVVRWIGVHEDQPLLYLRPDGERIPATGFVRLYLAGDDTLMVRKRAVTLFASSHPALEPLLDQPGARARFRDNSQSRDALEDAVLATRGVFAVQGPPGTGKTHLATEVVRRFLARTPSGRVLVCAKEHFALDHILRKLTAALARDGAPFRAWRSVSLARQRRGRAELDATWLGGAVVRELAARNWAPEAAGWTVYQAATADQHDLRLVTLGQQAANLFFCTTMDGAMVDFMDRESFDLVIVEEAGKCYPSELLHALCLGRTVLMIGDQRQLPPYQERRTRQGVDAWHKTLGRAQREQRHRDEMVQRFGEVFLTLEALADERGPLTEEEQSWLRPFELLFDRLPTRHRLEEQFRMEAPLSRVIGSVFYDRPFHHRKGELVEQGLLPPRPLGDVLPAELDVPLLWIDTPHMTEVPDATEDPQKHGVRDNHHERDVLLRYLRCLRPVQKLDLVILTPYNAQKHLLLGSDALRDVCARLTSAPLTEIVHTTDEYQGREAELTILSLVRNNSQGARAWGFMTELERLNVMFSRARFRQVVVGCSAHIERHAREAEWLHRVWQAYRREAQDPQCARILRPEELPLG